MLLRRREEKGWEINVKFKLVVEQLFNPWICQRTFKTLSFSAHLPVHPYAFSSSCSYPSFSSFCGDVRRWLPLSLRVWILPPPFCRQPWNLPSSPTTLDGKRTTKTKNPALNSPLDKEVKGSGNWRKYYFLFFTGSFCEESERKNEPSSLILLLSKVSHIAICGSILKERRYIPETHTPFFSYKNV